MYFPSVALKPRISPFINILKYFQTVFPTHSTQWMVKIQDIQEFMKLSFYFDLLWCHSFGSLHQQNEERIFSVGKKDTICAEEDSRGEGKDTEGYGKFYECRCRWICHSITHWGTENGIMEYCNYQANTVTNLVTYTENLMTKFNKPPKLLFIFISIFFSGITHDRIKTIPRIRYVFIN